MALTEKSVATANYDCAHCSTEKKVHIGTSTSFFSALMVVLIPKCHLCVMAYSSAITICGGPDMYMQSNNWLSYLPLVLGLFIIGVIQWNYRGVRSALAAGIAICGFLLILFTHQLVIDPIYYHIGTALMFGAIWLNSNMISFFNFLHERATIKTIGSPN
ncbi:MAG: hypothetical protein AAGC88_17220 [Bacteroidota bacterium]